MIKFLKGYSLVTFASLVFSLNAFAVTLHGEYSIGINVTPHGSNSYTFDYYITNIDQSVASGIQPVGLDGFSVSIPSAAVITSITNPPVYSDIWPGPPSYWVNTIQTIDKKSFIAWWGIEWDSVYPVGETAHFGFTADNVDVGTVDADVTTFWNGNRVGFPAYLASNGAYYTNYSTSLLGAVAISSADVPEPSAFLLIGAGLAGIGFLSRRSRHQTV